jgi:hypothetical protein
MSGRHAIWLIEIALPGCRGREGHSAERDHVVGLAGMPREYLPIGDGALGTRAADEDDRPVAQHGDAVLEPS